MDNENFSQFIEKLKLQVTSFQEEFSILSQSGDLDELARNFHHILRGNLLINDVNFFHRTEKDWTPNYIHNTKSLEFLDKLVTSDEMVLRTVSNDQYKIVITLPQIDKSWIGLVIGAKMDRTNFSEADQISLRIFLQLLDHSYQSFITRKKEKQFSFELNHRIVQLNSLIDTGIELSKLNNIATLFETSIERVVSITNASFGMIQIFENNQVVKEFIIPEGLPKEMILYSGNQIKSEMEFNSKRYVFIVSDKESREGSVPFETTDELLLGAFARQVFTALENQLHHEETVEIETLKRELSVASDIQKKIIPSKLPEIKGYDLAGKNIPSKEVGGDYYDCFLLSEGRFAFVMADVAGKGVPASLLVSTLNASLSAYMSMNMSLSDLAEKLNSVIYKSSPSDKFITCLIAILEPETGKLSFVNAGHNPGFILRNDGSLFKIGAGGLPLGMMDAGIPFDSSETIINSGEKLLLYTDGIPEAMNEEYEEFTDEKLELFFSNYTHSTAVNFVEHMIHEVKNYAGTAPQSDDITVLYLSRL